MVPGVATLDRSPNQSPRGEAHIPQSLGTKGNQEGWPSWVEYRSGGTGGPHPGVDIFPDLSPRAKPTINLNFKWFILPVNSQKT